MTRASWFPLTLTLTGLAALALLSPASQEEPAFDLVIRNGWVVDGSGNPAYPAEIAIREGRIARIGDNLPRGKEEVDARGQIVAPGFIDVHTHAENVVRIPNAENFVRMGVTSIVIGNCGGSEADLGELFTGLEEKPVSVNVASLIGHNTVRRAAMGGNFNRPPNPEETAKMRDMVEKAMKDGAVGLSTGLIYLPGTYSTTDEIIPLARLAGQHGGLYATHMRSESTRIFEAIDEMLRIGRESGARVQYSHIKLSGEHMWGRHQEVLAKLEEARQAGLEITQDQYAYTASSTGISTLIPDEALEGGTEAFKARLEDPVQKTRFIAQMKQTLATRKRTDYAYAVIARCAADPRLNGKNLVEAARIRTGKDDLDAQIETIFWIQQNGGAGGVFHGMSEADLQAFMRHPNTMIACDASARAFGEDVPHPRGYGNNARVLGRYVRELKVLRLEDAIRRMTSLPAQTFRFRDRGLLREGMRADVVVFDPAKVTDPSTFTAPHAYATGFRLVLVNGVAVVREDQHTGARPGQPLRGPGYSPLTRSARLARAHDHEHARVRQSNSPTKPDLGSETTHHCPCGG